MKFIIEVREDGITDELLSLNYAASQAGLQTELTGGIPFGYDHVIGAYVTLTGTIENVGRFAAAYRCSDDGKKLCAVTHEGHKLYISDLPERQLVEILEEAEILIISKGGD